MKRNRISIILLSLLVLTSLVGIFSMNGFAQETDLNYTFEQETIYDYPLHQSTTNYNVKDNELLNYTQIYNATYTYTNEADGTSGGDIEGVDSTSFDTYEIVSNYLGHDKIIHVVSAGGANSAHDNFNPSQTSGTIDFWWNNPIADDIYFRVRDDNQDYPIVLRFTSETNIDIYHGDGVGGRTTIAVGVIEDSWVHVEIQFDCGTDTQSVWINGILEVDDENFDNDDTSINLIYIRLFTPDASELYLDAIGYSWDIDYAVSDNIVPYYTNITVNNEWEADKWVFSFNDALDDLYAIGSDVFSDWDEIDDGDDKTNIVSDPLDGQNRRIKLEHVAPNSQDLGIERDFSVESGYLNISWGVEFDSWNGLNKFSTKIYSFDDTLVADVFFQGNNIGIDTPLTTFKTGLTLNVYYELNLYVNYDSDYAVLRFYGDGSFIGTFIFNLFSTGKDGLGKIESFIDNSAVSDMVCYLDYIGVYVNGSSLSTELAFKRFQNLGWNFQTWVFNEHNLISFEGYGDIILWETDPVWLIGIADTTLLTERYFVNDTLKVFNIYGHLHEGATPSVESPSLFIQFFNELNISEITIEGVKLNEGSNEYPLIYTYGNVDIDESYFYVDSSNRLNGVCHYNDSGLEFIQANFDINNVLNENRSLRFRSKFSGEYGFFSLSYSDATSSTIDLPISITSHNIQLTQAKTIDEFVFLISDNDNLDAGYGSGQIYEIRLLWNPSISITIITIALIMVIIPIIIMIVPTLTLYSRYGKSVIMPVFIFMAIICFAGGLIPAWLFFILMIGAGGFLVLKKGSDE